MAVLVVEVSDVESSRGQIMAALCEGGTFDPENCRHSARTPAVAPVTRIEFAPVPPGRYAVKAIHDENASEALDKNVVGVPTEGYGFSRDPSAIFGPPAFDSAAIDLLPGRQTIGIDLIHLLSGDLGAADDRSPQ